MGEIKESVTSNKREMKRIIFVGMHNKPGMGPLDSKTRSGKLIDRVIKELRGFDCIKTNLIDKDYWPETILRSDVSDWAYRVDYSSNDIVVCLGECVRVAMRQKSIIDFIGMGHPSAVWSHEKQDEYIQLALKRIKSIL